MTFAPKAAHGSPHGSNSSGTNSNEMSPCNRRTNKSKRKSVVSSAWQRWKPTKLVPRLAPRGHIMRRRRGQSQSSSLFMAFQRNPPTTADNDADDDAATARLPPMLDSVLGGKPMTDESCATTEGSLSSANDGLSEIRQPLIDTTLNFMNLPPHVLPSDNGKLTNATTNAATNTCKRQLHPHTHQQEVEPQFDENLISNLNHNHPSLSTTAMLRTAPSTAATRTHLDASAASIPSPRSPPHRSQQSKDIPPHIFDESCCTTPRTQGQQLHLSAFGGIGHDDPAAFTPPVPSTLPLVVSAKRLGNEVRRNHSSKRRRARQNHHDNSNNDNDDEHQKESNHNFCLMSEWRGGGKQSSDRSGNWDGDSSSDEHPNSTNMPTEQELENMTPDERKRQYWMWCYGTELPETTASLPAANRNSHVGDKDTLAVFRQVSWSASRLPPTKSILSVTKPPRGFAHHRPLHQRSDSVPLPSLDFDLQNTPTIGVRSVTLDSIDQYETPRASPVDFYENTATKASHNRTVQFGFTIAAEYEIGGPTNNLTPLAPEVARIRFPVVQKDEPEEEHELSEETKRNSAILAQWDDCDDEFDLDDAGLDLAMGGDCRDDDDGSYVVDADDEKEDEDESDSIHSRRNEKKQKRGSRRNSGFFSPAVGSKSLLLTMPHDNDNETPGESYESDVEVSGNMASLAVRSPSPQEQQQLNLCSNSTDNSNKDGSYNKTTPPTDLRLSLEGVNTSGGACLIGGCSQSVQMMSSPSNVRQLHEVLEQCVTDNSQDDKNEQATSSNSKDAMSTCSIDLFQTILEDPSSVENTEWNQVTVLRNMARYATILEKNTDEVVIPDLFLSTLTATPVHIPAIRKTLSKMIQAMELFSKATKTKAPLDESYTYPDELRTKMDSIVNREWRKQEVNFLRTLSKQLEQKGERCQKDTLQLDQQCQLLTDSRVRVRAGSPSKATKRDGVEELLRRVSPKEIDNIDGIMFHFNGREEELMDTLKVMDERRDALKARSERNIVVPVCAPNKHTSKQYRDRTSTRHQETVRQQIVQHEHDIRFLENSLKSGKQALQKVKARAELARAMQDLSGSLSTPTTLSSLSSIIGCLALNSISPFSFRTVSDSKTELSFSHVVSGYQTCLVCSELEQSGHGNGKALCAIPLSFHGVVTKLENDSYTLYEKTKMVIPRNHLANRFHQTLSCGGNLENSGPLESTSPFPVSRSILSWLTDTSSGSSKDNTDLQSTIMGFSEVLGHMDLAAIDFMKLIDRGLKVEMECVPGCDDDNEHNNGEHEKDLADTIYLSVRLSDNVTLRFLYNRACHECVAFSIPTGVEVVDPDDNLWEELNEVAIDQFTKTDGGTVAASCSVLQSICDAVLLAMKKAFDMCVKDYGRQANKENDGLLVS